MLRVVSPGDRIVQFSRSAGQSLFAAARSADLAFLRIVNHSISGGHYILQECDGGRIPGCSSLPSPGKSYGANADGAHIRSSTVVPWIEGCYFEAVGDDGAAIFAKCIAVLGHPTSTKVLLEEQFFNLEMGDHMIFFNPRDWRKVGEEFTITEVSQRMTGPEGKPYREVSFAPELPEQLRFGFPDVWTNDQVFKMAARHEGFVVRRNTFRDIRRYGVIARAEQGAIEDNQIIGTSDSAITLQNEPDVWLNGLHSVGIRIAGNRILGQLPSLPGAGLSPAIFLDHITNATISDNTFEDLQQGTVPVSKGQDVELRPGQ